MGLLEHREEVFDLTQENKTRLLLSQRALDRNDELWGVIREICKLLVLELRTRTVKDLSEYLSGPHKN
jgi:hypothetical protein